MKTITASSNGSVTFLLFLFLTCTSSCGELVFDSGYRLSGFSNFENCLKCLSSHRPRELICAHNVSAMTIIFSCNSIVMVFRRHIQHPPSHSQKVSFAAFLHQTSSSYKIHFFVVCSFADSRDSCSVQLKNAYM